MYSSGKKIIKVSCCSPASRASIRSGDFLISCNNQPITDWVDFFSFATGITILLRIKRGPIVRNFTLRRKLGNPWGIKLEGTKTRTCANHCVFCFVDQQPDGLRNTLSIKDDDVRYSFLSGTYITLTNKQADEAIARGFSSLHVSVQVTNAKIRGKLLGLSHPLPILPQINRLANNNIDVQAQIVEVPGWNNNSILEKTVEDLYNCKNVGIVGVVPVGLTKWRKNLTFLSTHSQIEAQNTLRIIKKWQQRALEERFTNWIYASDEYYSVANEPIPPIKHYTNCSLGANGIGLLAKMIDICKAKTFKGTGVILTGTLATPYIKKALINTNYEIFSVLNNLMGDKIGVSGLLSGNDIISFIKKHSFKTSTIYLPSAMFNHYGVTLDELTVEEITKRTQTNIIIANSIGDLP